MTNVLVERCPHPSQSINSQQLTPSVHNCLTFYTPARLKTSDGFFLHRWPVLCLTAEKSMMDLLWWMFVASGLHFLHSLLKITQTESENILNVQMFALKIEEQAFLIIVTINKLQYTSNLTISSIKCYGSQVRTTLVQLSTWVQLLAGWIYRRNLGFCYKSNKTLLVMIMGR